MRKTLLYRRDIDGLRAIAILAVIGYHLSPKYIKGGFVGVDIFFVISGFLITGIILAEIENGIFSFKTFYQRRIRRIFPTLILVLASILATAPLFLVPDTLARLGRHVVAGSLFSSNFLLWSEAGYFDGDSLLKPLLHLWSLGIEEQFYLLWPVTLWVIWKTRQKPVYFIAAIAAFSFALNIFFIRSDISHAFYAPWTRAWELMAGSLLAVKTRQEAPPAKSVFLPNNKNKLDNAASCLGLALIVIAIVFFDEKTPFPGWPALAPTIGAALIIAAGPMTWINRQLLSNRVAVFIGLISYALYLWHWPLLVYVNIYEPETVRLWHIFKFGAVGLAFILATLCYLYLEVPLRKLPLRTVSRVLVTLALITLIIGGATAFLPSMHPSNAGLTNFQTQISQDQLAESSAEKEFYREDLCFLKEPLSNDFAPACQAGGKPEMFLWGDSNAADLYWGLKGSVVDPDRHVSQYTMASCAPLIGFSANSSQCSSINTRILSRIRINKPDTIIISARWFTYIQEHDFIAALNKTIEAIKPETRTVVLVGPQVLFHDTPKSYFLPKPYLLSLRPQALSAQKGDLILISNSSLYALASIDQTLKNLAERQGIKYISLLSMACQDDRCPMVRIQDGAPKLLLWDATHLTRAGSSYYVNEAIAPVLQRSGFSTH